MSRVPRIRFKGFKEDWEQRKLGEIVDVCNGRDYKHLLEGDIPVYGTGGYMISVNKALSYDRDAIGIGRKGTIDKPYILNAPFWTVDTLFYVIPRDKGTLSFVFGIFQNIDWEKKDESTGVPSLSKTAINEIDVFIPKYEEQQVLGLFFNGIDHLITLHQSKSFGHILKIIAGYTLYWEQRKLGEIGSVAMCRRIFKYQTTESGDIPFFKIGSFGGTPDAFISKDLFESFKVKYPYPEKGDVLISASGSIGRTVVFTGKDEYFQDSNIVWLKHNNSIINSFLNYLYSTVKWAGIEGTTIKRLYNDNILKTEAIIPTLLEQQKISDYLDGINHLITLHQLEPFKLIFKAMAYRIIDYAKSEPPRYKKYTDLN